MLRISKLADYATIIMVYLARHADSLHTAKAIAKQIYLSAPTVSKLLKLLLNSKLLESQRGAKGGYSLARHAHSISVAQIIQAVEGNRGLTTCSDEEGNCSLVSVCVMCEKWRSINQILTNTLDGITLAELAKPKMTIEVGTTPWLNQYVN